LNLFYTIEKPPGAARNVIQGGSYVPPESPVSLLCDTHMSGLQSLHAGNTAFDRHVDGSEQGACMQPVKAR